MTFRHGTPRLRKLGKINRPNFQSRAPRARSALRAGMLRIIESPRSGVQVCLNRRWDQCDRSACGEGLPLLADLFTSRSHVFEKAPMADSMAGKTPHWIVQACAR